MTDFAGLTRLFFARPRSRVQCQVAEGPGVHRHTCLKRISSRDRTSRYGIRRGLRDVDNSCVIKRIIVSAIDAFYLEFADSASRRMSSSCSSVPTDPLILILFASIRLMTTRKVNFSLQAFGSIYTAVCGLVLYPALIRIAMES